MINQAAISGKNARQWRITTSGQWTVPYTGRYYIEIHGGGGGGAAAFVGDVYGSAETGGGGGGSGAIFIKDLTAGSSINVTVGPGGAGGHYTGGNIQGGCIGEPGGDTKFGDLLVNGGEPGGRGPAHEGGTCAGHLASNGESGALNANYGSPSGSGGTGGSSEGQYGDGGQGGTINRNSNPLDGKAGNDGVVIITFLKE